MITAQAFRSKVAAWPPPLAVRELVTTSHPPLDCADGYVYVGPDQDCRWDIVLFERALWCLHDGNVRMRAPIRSFRPRLDLDHVELDMRFRDALRSAAGEQPAAKLAVLIDALVFRGNHFLWPGEPNVRAGDMRTSGAEALIEVFRDATLTCALLDQAEARGRKSVALAAFATDAWAGMMMKSFACFLAKGHPERLAVEIWLPDHRRLAEFESGAADWIRPRTVPFFRAPAAPPR